MLEVRRGLREFELAAGYRAEGVGPDELRAARD
jgi:hypothetical protein